MAFDRSRTDIPSCIEANFGRECIRDLNPQLNRGRLYDGVSPTVTVNYRGWKVYEQRRVSAWEAMALQGLYPELFPAIDDFKPRQLMHIAGEAFCMPQILAVVVSVLINVTFAPMDKEEPGWAPDSAGAIADTCGGVKSVPSPESEHATMLSACSSQEDTTNTDMFLHDFLALCDVPTGC